MSNATKIPAWKKLGDRPNPKTWQGSAASYSRAYAAWQATQI